MLTKPATSTTTTSGTATGGDAVDLTSSGATWVAAAPFRSHLLFLSQACNVSWPVLAALAGVSHRGARALVVGRGGHPLRRIHPGIASRVLALNEERVQDAAGHLVGAEGVRHRLLELTTAGWTVTGLAERIRMPLSGPGLAALLHAPWPATCSELTAAVVAALTILCSAEAPPTSLLPAAPWPTTIDQPVPVDRAA